ncbi:MAG: DUF4142 domain-containing protein [Capsulimonadales bacterium]|nr:DUF4142 domain-containing protein [Capsulimonadales bacterium]
MMNKVSLGVAALLGTLSVAVFVEPASAQNTRMQQGTSRMASSGSRMQGNLTMAGKRFINKAAIGGMFEVRSSQLALKKSRRQDIRQFAQMMVNAHTQVNGQLKQIARTKGVTVPANLDRSHQRMYNQLARLNGAAFDNAYLKAQHMAHVAAVDVFSNGSVAPRDSDLKSFAGKVLPDIREHLTMVQNLRDGNGMGRMTGAGSSAAPTATADSGPTP